jgi:hypothetical protein
MAVAKLTSSPNPTVIAAFIFNSWCYSNDGNVTLRTNVPCYPHLQSLETLRKEEQRELLGKSRLDGVIDAPIHQGTNAPGHPLQGAKGPRVAQRDAHFAEAASQNRSNALARLGEAPKIPLPSRNRRAMKETLKLNCR